MPRVSTETQSKTTPDLLETVTLIESSMSLSPRLTIAGWRYMHVHCISALGGRPRPNSPLTALSPLASLVQTDHLGRNCDGCGESAFYQSLQLGPQPNALAFAYLEQNILDDHKTISHTYLNCIRPYPNYVQNDIPWDLLCPAFL